MYYNNFQNPERQLQDIENRLGYLDNIIRTSYNQMENVQAKAEMDILLKQRDELMMRLNGMNRPGYSDNPYGSSYPRSVSSNSYVPRSNVDSYGRPMYPSSRPAQLYNNSSNGSIFRNDAVMNNNQPTTSIRTDDRYSNKVKMQPQPQQYTSQYTPPPQPVEETLNMGTLVKLESILKREPTKKSFTLVKDLKEESTIKDLLKKGAIEEQEKDYLTSILNDITRLKLGISAFMEDLSTDLKDIGSIISSKENGALKLNYFQKECVDKLLEVELTEDVNVIEEDIVKITNEEYKEIMLRFLTTSVNEVYVPELLQKLLEDKYSFIEENVTKRLLLLVDEALPKYLIISKRVDTNQFVLALP